MITALSLFAMAKTTLAACAHWLRRTSRAAFLCPDWCPFKVAGSHFHEKHHHWEDHWHSPRSLCFLWTAGRNSQQQRTTVHCRSLFWFSSSSSSWELHPIILPQWSSQEICSSAEEELETEFSADNPAQPSDELPVNTTHYNWCITCRAFPQTAAESSPVNGETRPRGSSPSQAGEAEGAAWPWHKDPVFLHARGDCWCETVSGPRQVAMRRCCSASWADKLHC